MIEELETLLYQAGDYASEGILIKAQKAVEGQRWLGNDIVDLPKLARIKEIIGLLKGGEVNE